MRRGAACQCRCAEQAWPSSKRVSEPATRRSPGCGGTSETFITFLAFAGKVRRVVYTTNMIESINYRLYAMKCGAL
ncbi:MAG TPA: transposase [Acidimicrobiia bacterium]|nr:transposase [Acidimicrobiia bacterium]